MADDNCSAVLSIGSLQDIVLPAVARQSAIWGGGNCRKDDAPAVARDAHRGGGNDVFLPRENGHPRTIARKHLVLLERMFVAYDDPGRFQLVAKPQGWSRKYWRMARYFRSPDMRPKSARTAARQIALAG